MSNVKSKNPNQNGGSTIERLRRFEQAFPPETNMEYNQSATRKVFLTSPIETVFLCQ